MMNTQLFSKDNPHPDNTEIALFAGGCFWGVEYLMQQADGVLSVTSGFSGGEAVNPTYEEVCTGKTGHAEVVKVVYDPQRISYEQLVRLFFEIHDPTQMGGQGPDIGDQYRSEIFYLNVEQKSVAQQCIQLLKSKGCNVVTTVTKAKEFYPATPYHQDYYMKNGKVPYCHSYVKRF